MTFEVCHLGTYFMVRFRSFWYRLYRTPHVLWWRSKYVTLRHILWYPLGHPGTYCIVPLTSSDDIGGTSNWYPFCRPMTLVGILISARWNKWHYTLHLRQIYSQNTKVHDPKYTKFLELYIYYKLYGTYIMYGYYNKLWKCSNIPTRKKKRTSVILLFTGVNSA